MVDLERNLLPTLREYMTN